LFIAETADTLTPLNPFRDARQANQWKQSRNIAPTHRWIDKALA